MVDTTEHFQIKKFDDLIYVRLRGVWTVPQDLAYLTALVRNIEAFKGKQWSIFVDMRGWTLPLEVFESPFKSKVMLDRRNQLCEAWLVDQPQQGELLLTFFKDNNFAPERFLEVNEAFTFLLDKGVDIAPLVAIYQQQ